jgi:hypothetical protein
LLESHRGKPPHRTSLQKFLTLSENAPQAFLLLIYATTVVNNLGHQRRADCLKLLNAGKMNEFNYKIKLRDNGGRRSGIERRQYSYTSHIPEGRNGEDRRNRKDRRKTPRLFSRLQTDG